MEGVLWYVLASSRGGPTRSRILRALDERPRNANQLAEALDLDYTTVRHHLEVLVDNNVVRRAGDGYGDVYLLTDQVEHNRELLEEVLETVDADGERAGEEDGADDGRGSADDGEDDAAEHRSDENRSDEERTDDEDSSDDEDRADE